MIEYSLPDPCFDEILTDCELSLSCSGCIIRNDHDVRTDKWRLAALDVIRKPRTDCSFKFTLKMPLRIEDLCVIGFLPTSTFFKAREASIQPLSLFQDGVFVSLGHWLYRMSEEINTIELLLTRESRCILFMNEKEIYRDTTYVYRGRFTDVAMRPFICLREAFSLEVELLYSSRGSSATVNG